MPTICRHFFALCFANMNDDSNNDGPVTSATYENLLRFFESPLGKAETAIDHPYAEGNRLTAEQLDSYRQAAVLIPVTRLNDNESHVVLTVRSENLRSHAGQISLPGGSIETQDRDLTETALRESHEEIGLHPDEVDVIGRLGELVMPSGFRITPVVGIIGNELQFSACPVEVADIFHAPLELVLNPQAYVRSTVRYKDKDRPILELHYEDYRIWGATAAILHHLAVAISDTGN